MKKKVIFKYSITSILNQIIKILSLKKIRTDPALAEIYIYKYKQKAGFKCRNKSMI